MVAPAGWKEVRLGEICDFVKTIALSRSQLEADHGVGCIHYGDIHTKFNDRLDCSIIRLPMAESEMVVGVPRLKIGDLVIADASEDMMGVGKGIEILGVPDHGVVAVLRPQVGLFSKGFLGQLQHMPEFKEQARVLASGLKVYGLSKTSISKISVTIPPLKEQEAIAEALTDADAAIESLDALIVKKRDVKQATMQQLLTGRTRLPGFTADWKEVRLGEVVRFARKTIDPLLLGDTIVEHFSIPAYDAGHAEFVSASTIKSLKMLLDEECVLISRLNPRIPRVWHVLPGSHEALASTEFMPIAPIVEKTQPRYLKHLFLSNKCTVKLKEMAIGTTGSHQRAQPADVLALHVSLPPLKEQEAIAQALSVIDDELEALSLQASKLRMVKEGMMQVLLTGKVRLA